MNRKLPTLVSQTHKRKRAAWRRQCEGMEAADKVLTWFFTLFWIYVALTSRINWEKVEESQWGIIASMAGAMLVFWVCLRIAKAKGL